MPSSSPDPVVSIIICTRDHAPALKETLKSLADVNTPSDLTAELIVADNGSKDDTAKVVEEAAPRLTNLTGGVRRILEPRGGQCFARNAGIAAARGQIILFTDDDLRFPRGWIEGICRPILSGEADAVVGGVTLAPHLQRPWMTPHHRTWLACTDCIRPEAPWLVGANFAFSRRVLEAVPEFDTELGPGQLGFGDDSLFGEQITAAGYRIVARLETAVEHHCDADRVLRKSYLSSAAKHGRTLAYLAYHWHHEDRANPTVSYWRNRILLSLRRLTRWKDWHTEEGMPEWEMHYVQFLHFYKHWVRESQRPRLYEKHGMRKKEGVG